ALVARRVGEEATPRRAAVRTQAPDEDPEESPESRGVDGRQPRVRARLGPFLEDRLGERSVGDEVTDPDAHALERGPATRGRPRTSSRSFPESGGAHAHTRPRG